MRQKSLIHRDLHSEKKYFADAGKFVGVAKNLYGFRFFVRNEIFRIPPIELDNMFKL